jgi:DNA replication protein DnaC
MARDLQTRHVVDAVKAYVEELPSKVAEGRGIWLMGGTGTGKTTLTMLVAKAAGERGFAVGVYFAPKLLARIRQTYQAESNEDSYLEFFERLASVDLLVVDDLGAERKTDWVIEQLYAVVNERYERQLPIAITSNADGTAVDAAIEQLKAEIGARTVSRLVEICGDPLPLFGEDRRYGLGLAS